jgi:hypothetical protein
MPSSLAAIANWTADFGEFLALAPAVLAAGLCLWLDHRRSAACAWFYCLAGSLGLAALLKAVHAPVSGHAAVAVAVLGGFAVLMARDAFALGRAARLVAALLVLLAAAVCIAVYALHWHSAVDLAGGILVGALAPAGMAWVRIESGEGAGNGALALVVVAGLAVALHGIRLDERAAHHIHLAIERVALAWHHLSA